MFKSLLFTLGILPMTALAFQVGAWVGGPGQYPQPTQENVQAFQDLQGTHIDLISYFALFDVNDWNATEEFANVAKDNGSTLVVTWMANGYANTPRASKATAKKSGSGRSTKQTATGTTGA